MESPITEDKTSLAEETALKTEVLEKKRAKFAKVFKVIKVLAALIVLVIIILIVISALRKEAEPTVPPFQTVPNGNNTTEPLKPETWILHKDEDLKVFLTYPPEAKLQFTETPYKHLDVLYEKDNATLETLTEDTLKEGYIFRVTPLNITIQDLAKVVEIKRESFKLKCPSSAVVSSARDLLVDTIDAKTFSISKCNVDYQVTYIPRYGIYYELLQIYKGDVGFRQQYKSITDEIFLSFRFFPEETTTPPPLYATYLSEQFKFLLRHPNLNETCCQVPAPLTKGNKEIITLVNSDTFVDETKVDGIGIYYANLNTSLEEYIAGEELALEDQYKVVVGNSPNKVKEPVNVGSLEGTALRGYSWKGNDLIFIQIPASERVLIISTSDTGSAEFNVVIKEILDSIEFF